MNALRLNANVKGVLLKVNFQLEIVSKHLYYNE